MEEFGKGGIPSPKDTRDYQYENIGRAGEPFDWSVGFNIEDSAGKLHIKNQKSTSACGGFAWSQLSYVLDPTNREEKSEKFIYAHTNAPGGGSWGRANCELCRTKGVSSKALCPLPSPLTEANIIKNDISQEAYKDALTNREKSYLNVSPNIDAIAQAVRDSKGVVIGITGKDNGTWRSDFPKPPDNLIDSWRHWVMVGKAKLIDGKKYLGFINSWGNVGQDGWQWIGEDYFKYGYIWEAWAMVYLDEVPYVFTKLLRYGMRGFDVKMLQQKLKISADGIFGQQTSKAVREFQTKHGLVADGIVGSKTNRQLNLSV
jgi:peptidoglycan hydrolase-like protein with peptidoglycan-binding domain